MFHQPYISQSLCFNGEMGQVEVRQFCILNHICLDMMKSAMIWQKHSNIGQGICTAGKESGIKFRTKHSETVIMNENRSTDQKKWTQSLAKMILKKISWKLDVSYQEAKSYVLVGAPHTSNLDFIFTMLLIYATGIKMNWIAKDSLFRWPFGSIFRRLGGIAVNRKSRNEFVRQMVAAFDQNKNLVVAISPEGTRSKANYWKTGFYYIALAAQVPIVMGYIDYEKKILGIGPSFYPTGDIKKDFEQIKRFYSDKKGKYPGKQGTIKLRPD
jgi:1-acyl-sn-glycerol-3-phosphate acyltransferase